MSVKTKLVLSFQRKYPLWQCYHVNIVKAQAQTPSSAAGKCPLTVPFVKLKKKTLYRTLTPTALPAKEAEETHAINYRTPFAKAKGMSQSTK
jgi:hypothetical protein